jgi:hypothetical protein
VIPDVATVLGGLARTLMIDLGAEVKSPYGALTIQLGAGLLAMIAQESDRAAARLVEENEALSALFEAADVAVADPTLREAMQGARANAPASLLVSDLRRRNRELRALLIRLHDHVETLDDARGRALEAAIWSELAASVRRRQLDLAIA